jgi:hypothetical protein
MWIFEHILCLLMCEEMLVGRCPCVWRDLSTPTTRVRWSRVFAPTSYVMQLHTPLLLNWLSVDILSSVFVVNACFHPLFPDTHGKGVGVPWSLGWGFCLNVSVKLEIVAPVHSAWAHVGISSVFAFSLLGWRQTFWSVLFCLLTVNAYTLSSGKIPTAAHC